MMTTLTLSTITCGDASAPTGPSEGLVAGRVALTLTFTPQAALAFALLGQGVNAVTELRVRVTPVGGSALDTVFAAPTFSDSLRLDLPLRIRGIEQSLASIVELRATDHSVLFSASQVVIARAANLPIPPAQPLTLNYSGPGSSATTLVLSASDTTIQGSAVVTYSATARDASSTALSDVLVLWTSSDTSVATVTASGTRTVQLRTSGKRGTTALTGTTPLGVSAGLRVSVVPVPTQIVIVSGAVQAGVAGGTLAQPLVVEVRAADGLPVPGTLVTFRAITPGASVVNVSAVTDAAGRASASMVLGRTAGSYQFEVSASGLTGLSVSASASAAPAAALSKVSGDGQADSLGTALSLPLVVKVVDQFGGPSDGQSVRWAVESGSGSLASSTSTTALDGTARIAYTLGNRAGNDVITATVLGLGGSSGVVQFSASAIARGVAQVVIVSGGAQSADARTTLPSPLVVRVEDAVGNPLAGVQIAWSSTAGATVTPATAITNASGQASASVVFGSTAGSVTISARASTRSVSTAMTITQPPPASIEVYQNTNASVTVGSTTSHNPTVIVKDAGGYPVPNAPVVFAVEGNGSVTGATTLTDSVGITSVGSWTLDTIARENWLVATTGSRSTRISVFGVAGPAAKFAFLSNVTRLVVGGRHDFLFEVVDRYGNGVFRAGIPVALTWSAGPNGASVNLTTDGGGYVQYVINSVSPPNGTATFTVTSAGLATTTFSLPVVSGAAYSISGPGYRTFYALPGQAITPGVTIQLLGPDGSPVGEAGHAITAALGNSPGALAGTTTLVTDVNGRATFADLSFTLPGRQFITFNAPGLYAGAAAVWGVTSLPSSIAVTAGNNQSVVAGNSVAVAPVVKISDGAGNPVPFAWVTIVVLPDDDGQVRGDLDVNGQVGSQINAMTDASGIVRINRWTVTTRAGSRALAVFSQFNFPAQYVSATVLPEAGSQLKFTTLPSASAASGVALGGQPVLQLLDVFGNEVKTAGVVVTASITSGSGTLTNATATTDANGVATFSGLRITGTPGNVVLTFSTTGYAPLPSAAIRVY